MLVAQLLAALLSLLPVNSPAHRNMTREQARIAAQAADAADAYQVPIAVLLAVGFVETWCGTNRETDWGAPASASHRHVAGTARDAARVLATGFRVCGTWLGSAARFRSGACTGSRVGDDYARRAMGLVERMSTRAGVALPTGLRVREYARSSPAP